MPKNILLKKEIDHKLPSDSILIMKPLLVIITGLPATGKTTLAKRLSQETGLPLLEKDAFKVIMFDHLGWQDRDYSQKIGATSYGLLYHLLEELLRANQSMIIESNFKPETDQQKIIDLKNKYHPSILQIICQADKEIILERFNSRVTSGERHPGHVDHITAEELKNSFDSSKNDAMDLDSEVLEINTNNFRQIDYDKIIAIISSKLTARH